MNKLEHIDEFRKAIADYKLSDKAKETLQDLNLVLMVGPTSSGRNTAINELLKSGDYHFIVSDTTRKPRMNDGVMEEDGNQYWFRSEAEMLQEVRNGDFLEFAIIHNQQVSGMSFRELEIARRSNKIAITEVQPNGAHNAHAAKPDAKIIFNVPPGFEPWMERLRRRGAMPEAEICRRLEAACEEFEAALSRDYYRFVMSIKVSDTAAVVDAIARGTYDDPSAEAEAREMVKNLYRDTREYLSKHPLA